MKTSIMFCLLALIISLAACHRKKDMVVGESTAYACPMNCEGEKVYPKAGKCPVCKMHLDPRDETDQVLYDIWLTTHPEEPVAGEPTLLSFIPKVKGSETDTVPDEVNEQKLHVVMVSKDLSWYDHVHPKFQADGSYTVQETFPHGGEYIIFADYRPDDIAHQVERRTLEVSGVPGKREIFDSLSLSTETDVYKVTMKAAGGRWVTDSLIHLSVKVTKDGAPVTNFEDIMGAKGHLAIISGDGEKYLHVHPVDVEGKLDLQTQFDEPGFYRAFYQFQVNGQIYTSAFTLEVKDRFKSDSSYIEGAD